MLAASTVATAAPAKDPSIHSKIPDTNPAYGPNAVPT